MSVEREFSRFSKSYDRESLIQKEVAKELLSRVDTADKRVLELGSGTGIVANLAQFKELIAVDLSLEMCKLHPKAENIRVINADFDKSETFANFKDIDLVISSSALQWSQNLDRLFANISEISEKFAFAIFTDKTFETIHQISKTDSPIYSRERVLKHLNAHFKFEYYTKEYRVEFNSTKEMLRHIKNTGVSSSSNRLSYRETKKLIEEYPLSYLEFEVLFASNLF
jgi:malonyl-CoA O-methyltransferase